MMNQPEESRLDRVERILAEMAADQAQSRADFNERINQVNTALTNQVEVIAQMRTSIEILSHRDESERAQIAELRNVANTLLQVAQIHQGDIEALGVAVQRLQNQSD